MTVKEPVDLGQTPADVVILRPIRNWRPVAARRNGGTADTGLASMMHLIHPMSVDLHLDTCATKSRW
jgi:cobaltochelatase CobN